NNMKATIKISKEVELKIIEVKAGVWYWDGASVNDVEDTDGDLIPCREGDLWCPIIDIDSGVITNWEKGKRAYVHYKVADQFGYDIKDDKGEIVLSERGVYVP